MLSDLESLVSLQRRLKSWPQSQSDNSNPKSRQKDSVTEGKCIIYHRCKWRSLALSDGSDLERQFQMKKCVNRLHQITVLVTLTKAFS